MAQPDAQPKKVAPSTTTERRGHRGLAWFRVLHPFPSLVVAATGVGFAMLASPQPLAFEHGVRLAFMLAFSQFAVGAFNDYCDAALDAVAKPRRPIPSGAVSRRGALLAVAAFLLATLALAAPFGPLTFGLTALGASAGLAYDRVLKRTPWSWVPYVLGLPLIPLWSWSTLGDLPARAVWVYPVGALLALALHLANALPDLEFDRAANAGGLVQFLGRRASVVALALSFGLALVVGLIISLGDAVPQAHRLATYLGAAIGLVALPLANRAATARAAFPLVAVGSALIGVGLAPGLLG